MTTSKPLSNLSKIIPNISRQYQSFLKNQTTGIPKHLKNCEPHSNSNRNASLKIAYEKPTNILWLTSFQWLNMLAKTNPYSLLETGWIWLLIKFWQNENLMKNNRNGWNLSDNI